MVPPEAYAASNHYYQSLPWSHTEDPSWIEASRTTISPHGTSNITAYGETEASHGNFCNHYQPYVPYHTMAMGAIPRTMPDRQTIKPSPNH